MVVLSYPTIRDYFEKHSDAKEALNNFYRFVQKADWSNFHEVKQDFPAVDAIGNDRYVFDIRGNRYRLIAMIFFPIRTFYIRFIGTHAEYSKIKDASKE